MGARGLLRRTVTRLPFELQRALSHCNTRRARTGKK
jgi:hypothetical protein